MVILLWLVIIAFFILVLWLTQCSDQEQFWDQAYPVPYMGQPLPVIGRKAVIADVDNETIILINPQALPVNR